MNIARVTELLVFHMQMSFFFPLKMSQIDYVVTRIKSQ